MNKTEIFSTYLIIVLCLTELLRLKVKVEVNDWRVFGVNDKNLHLWSRMSILIHIQTATSSSAGA